jgi:outer membrane protein TolC
MALPDLPHEASLHQQLADARRERDEARAALKVLLSHPSDDWQDATNEND